MHVSSIETHPGIQITILPTALQPKKYWVSRVTGVILNRTQIQNRLYSCSSMNASEIASPEISPCLFPSSSKPNEAGSDPVISAESCLGVVYVLSYLLEQSFSFRCDGNGGLAQRVDSLINQNYDCACTSNNTQNTVCSSGIRFVCSKSETHAQPVFISKAHFQKFDACKIALWQVVTYSQMKDQQNTPPPFKHYSELRFRFPSTWKLKSQLQSRKAIVHVLISQCKRKACHDSRLIHARESMYVACRKV